MEARPVVIERVTRVAPLGLRFVDSLTGQVVKELSVSAFTAAQPARALPLLPNPSGVYVLHHLPGLRDFEHGAGDADFWASLPPAQRLTIAVSDPRGRFLPCTFPADAPARGLFEPPCEPPLSPAEPVSGVPLFSAPGRPIPPGFTAARADLYDPIAGRPAAWAVLTLSYQGRVLARGLADERGCLAAPLPYPAPVDFEPLSPLTTGAALTDQQWAVELEVSYQPIPPAPQPDLCAVLDQLSLPAARAWKTWQGPSGADWLTDAVISYGRELVLRTGEGGAPLPRLYIAPAVSPP